MTVHLIQSKRSTVLSLGDTAAQLRDGADLLTHAAACVSELIRQMEVA